MKEGLQDIIDGVSERLRAPFFGYVLLSFATINWKVIFVVLASDVSYEKKFEYFDANTSELTLFVSPIVIGIILSLFTPWVSNWAHLWAANPAQRKRLREARLAAQILELQVKHRATIDKQIEGIIAEAQQNDAIEKIEDAERRSQVEQTINELREQKTRNDQHIQVSRKREEELRRAISEIQKQLKPNNRPRR